MNIKICNDSLSAFKLSQCGSNICIHLSWTNNFTYFFTQRCLLRHKIGQEIFAN